MIRRPFTALILQLFLISSLVATLPATIAAASGGRIRLQGDGENMLQFTSTTRRIKNRRTSGGFDKSRRKKRCRTQARELCQKCQRNVAGDWRSGRCKKGRKCEKKLKSCLQRKQRRYEDKGCDGKLKQALRKQGLDCSISSLPTVKKNPAEQSLMKALTFGMSQPDRWLDPHGLVMVGTIERLIQKHFGRPLYDLFLAQVSNGIGFRSDAFGTAVCKLHNPDYPERCECFETPDAHETAVAILGMHIAGMTGINEHSLKSLTSWLKNYPDHDPFSIGLPIQALLSGGVSKEDSWETADGRLVTIEKLTDNAIEAWREERIKEDLKPGDVPKDLLLHLAPSLIVLRKTFPDLYQQKKYQPVLDEVFSFYESIMVDGQYWGYKGETFATGHIMEHYAMDIRLPPSFLGLTYMIEHQAEDGKYNLAENNFLGAHVHGMKGLYSAMEVFGYPFQ